ncbi:MAG: glycosyltransferase [Candidatus Kaiserbacteria bacterium]|nr:glycosyltransferase [Candidatus Kaiserbacteria bacterium]
MKRIKIAYVINTMLVAGAETVVFEMASHLDHERFEPIVYALFDHAKERPSLLPRFREAGIPVIFVSSRRVGIARSAIALRKLFKESLPDIVHVHLPDAVIAGGMAAASLRVPFIIHEHQVHTFHSRKIRLAFRLLRPFSALSVCYATGVEKQIFGTVHEIAEPPQGIERKSCTIHNGVDIERIEKARSTDHHSKRAEFGVGEDDILVVSVARFIEWKGHRDLIEAFAIASGDPRLKLLIAGDGQLRPDLLARAQELGLSERIIMPGIRSDIYETLSVADIFSLVFSYPEGTDAEAIGVAGFEAMASGLPVLVGAYTDASLYIRDGENGILVPPRNTAALAAAITRLALDPIERERIGENARAYVTKELNWSNIIRIYEAIYKIIVRI